jgi:peptidoglycan hydrolase-like protein with peptidoglycan-binding domain
MGLAASFVAAALASGCGIGSSDSTPSRPPAPPPPPTRVTLMPVQYSKLIADGAVPLGVHLSGTVAPGSLTPVIKPSVDGHWNSHGDTEVFTPHAYLTPCATYTITVPAGTFAVGQLAMAASRSERVKVACLTTRALQRTLARLDYLPYSLHTHAHIRLHAHESMHAAAEQAFQPVGVLRPRISDAPTLESGALDEVTIGALMTFQSDHNLSPDGTPGPSTWAALLRAVSHDEVNQSPYTWVTVSEGSPETLEVHRDGHVALSSPTNTGIPGAATATGTFPIFDRATTTTMTGTEPDGTKYVAPDVPWVNYFNGGDAVHGYPRASYGSPQSNGCVELPISTAQTVFGMLQIGDLVVVS